MTVPQPGVRHLSSRSNPQLQQVRKLAQDPVAYRKLGRVWLEGDHLCRAYIDRGGRPEQGWISASRYQEPDWQRLVHQAGSVVVVDDALWPWISGLESPAGVGYLLPLPPQAALLPQASAVVLDRLQDAGNVGTILRSAAAFGVRQVLALKGTAGLWSPKVLRSAMGAHFGLHLVEGLLPEDLQGLQVPLVATSSHTELSIDRLDLPQPMAWVFGHEGQGVAESVMARCQLKVRIPQPGGEESLNVASAAAVCLYEAARQAAVRARSGQ